LRIVIEQSMTDWILQTHFDSLSELIPHIRDRSSSVRVAAELDGLVIAGEESVEIAKGVLASPESEEGVSAATLVAFELQATTLYPDILNLLCGKNPYLRNGVRSGLRLSNIKPAVHELLRMARDAEPPAQIAIFDVLSFHRIQVKMDFQQLLKVDDPEARCLLLECLGRSRNANLVATFSQDTDPKIKKAFWKAMARSGHPDVVNACRRCCVQELPCHDAIRFLGVIGSSKDVNLLLKLSKHEATAVPAVEAMGILGATELIPTIITALVNPVTSQAAAVALERISGRGVPRNDPPPPPEHLTEDELDFWFHPGDPILEAVEAWWKQNHYYFEPGKRYQAGRCVSDNPLGPVFEELPDDIRMDIYLRQRALDSANTPDWELETWPKHHRNPAWASRQGSSLHQSSRTTL
jgi:uncharacterized protein (TIGR02270 family)